MKEKFLTKFVIGLFFICNLFDAVATYIAIKYFQAVEISPFMALIIYKLGFVCFFIYKLFVGIGGSWLLLKFWSTEKFARYAGWIVMIVYLLISIYHIIFLLR